MGVRGIDYNADGFYDLFLLGWSTAPLDGTSATQVGWFLPGSASGLTSYQRVPGASEHGIWFLDYGVTGALNFSFTGYHGDATYFTGEENGLPQGRSLVMTKNPWDVAARPDAPQSVEGSVDGNTVTLSWTAAASSMKNVTYEYYLKNKQTGKFYNNVTSFVGGDNDGIRKVLREGNAYLNKQITLKNIPDGVYEWGVQTVNAALRGSVFTNGTDLTVGNPDGISQLETEDGEVENYYSLDGKQLGAPQKGVNIVKTNKGIVKKVIL